MSSTSSNSTSSSNSFVSSNNSNNISNSNNSNRSGLKKKGQLQKKTVSNSKNSFLVKLLYGIAILTIIILIIYFLHLKKKIHILFFPNRDDPNTRL